MTETSPNNVLTHPTADRGGSGSGGGSDIETRIAVLEAKFDATVPTLAKREDVATILSTLAMVARKEDVGAVETRVFAAINGQTWKLIASAASLVVGTAVIVGFLDRLPK